MVPADPAAVQPPNHGTSSRRRMTIATLDLKVSITIDGDTHLDFTTLEKIEDDLQCVKIRTRKFMEESINQHNHLEMHQPPEKKMRCAVNGAVWTDTLV